MENIAGPYLPLTQIRLPDGEATTRALSPRQTLISSTSPLHIEVSPSATSIGSPSPNPPLRHPSRGKQYFSTQVWKKNKEQSELCFIYIYIYWIDLILFFSLTWKDAVGWMLTLACFQRSPWLPVRDQTGPSEVVWPFCFRKAFSVPVRGREMVALFSGQRT